MKRFLALQEKGSSVSELKFEKKGFSIVGAGVSGLFLAWFLIDKGFCGKKIKIFCKKNLKKETPLPIALINPLAGLSLVPKKWSLEAFEFSRQIYLKLEKLCPDRILLKHPLYRPVDPSDKSTLRLKKSFFEAKKACTGIIELQLLKNQEHPFGQFEEVILVSDVFSLNWPLLKDYLVSSLKDKGVHFSENNFMKKEDFSNKDVAFCMGAGLSEIIKENYFQVLKGELMSFSNISKQPFSISLKGHFSPGLNNKAVLGPTFFEGDDLRQEKYIKTQLLNIASRLFKDPLIIEDPKIWRGERMIYKKDKQPLVGKLKGRNHWVLGALGSRGFLWAPFLAEKLSESILENKEYSGPFSMERIGLV